MGAPAAHLVTESPRRFPVPWTFEDHNDACFIVKDANGMRRLPLRHLYVW